MGKFRVLVEAIGGHGCQREIKNGGEVSGCQLRHCPDCAAREFVAELKRKGNNVEIATLTHWPESDHQVVDDLLTTKRTGNF